MKVGLFGDSYACLTLDQGKAWFESPKILNDYELISFAKKGSDITYSYKLFLEHHSKFKKNIFFVTESTRHSFSVGSHKFHISNIDSIDLIKENINDFKVKKILTSLKDHYLYTMSIDLYDFGLAGMVEYIRDLRPDTIIIYGFYNRFMEKIIGNKFHLSQVSMLELEKFEIDFNFIKKTGIGEGRSAHLTDENNVIFAEYVKDRLDGKDKILDLSAFIIPSIESKKQYFPGL